MPYIAISYRDEGYGKGAFYDHFTIRSMTGWLTRISSSVQTLAFSNYIEKRSTDGYYGLPKRRNLPQPSLNYAEKAAFIVIPGYTRESDTKQPDSHKSRLQHEKQLIRKARYRGQPLLAICAGSWTLWKGLGGDICPVSDHNYGGAMPRLSKQSPGICNNKMIHEASAVEGSHLSDILHENVEVNSVHWNAVNENSPEICDNIRVSARSVVSDSIEVLSRQGNIMEPEIAVEAFENKHGAPILGIQWHPEAFDPNNEDGKEQCKIFSYLKTAGETYLNRRKLNEDFKQNCHTFFENRQEGVEESKEVDEITTGLNATHI